MPDETIQSISKYLDWVRECRKRWNLSESRKELWFRGERKPYKTILRPQLYRPPKERNMKPVPEVLDTENDLYEDFQRCAIQLREAKIPDDDWAWDSYFLMQHHNAPTRLLDWSDGALMALHFAVRNKTDDDREDPIVYVLEPYLLLDKLKALPDTEIAKQQSNSGKPTWRKIHRNNIHWRNGKRPTCRATTKTAQNSPYPGCLCCWISAISRGALPPNAAVL